LAPSFATLRRTGTTIEALTLAPVTVLPDAESCVKESAQ
jgi:hypothetical protein